MDQSVYPNYLYFAMTECGCFMCSHTQKWKEKPLQGLLIVGYI